MAHGNLLKRSQIDYHEAGEVHRFQRFPRADRLRPAGALRDAGDRSSTPIFMLGMPRSGTTLIEQILASHPLVHGAGELISL